MSMDAALLGGGRDGRDGRGATYGEVIGCGEGVRAGLMEGVCAAPPPDIKGAESESRSMERDPSRWSMRNDCRIQRNVGWVMTDVGEDLR